VFTPTSRREKENNNGDAVEECFQSGNGLYFTHIKPTSACNVSFYSDEPFSVPEEKAKELDLWHDRTGHPGYGMFQKIVKAVRGIPLKSADITRRSKTLCPACAMGKLPNRKKTAFSSTKFKPRGLFEMLVSDVCGPISPPAGPFNYFMVVKDASSRFPNVHLLTSKNEVMPKLLTSIIQIKAQFPDHPIKNVRVDNASEYVSKSFKAFCVVSGINLETSVPYAHNTNAENFVKLVQLVARPMLLRSNLNLSCWGHAVLHAGALLMYRPSAENDLTNWETASHHR